MPYSELPKLKPYLIAIMDFICLSYLVFYRFFKLKWRRMSNKDKARNYSLVLILFISTIDHSIALDTSYSATFCMFSRPFVIYIFFSSVRNNLWMIIQSCIDTGIIIGTILAYIAIFFVDRSVLIQKLSGRHS